MTPRLLGTVDSSNRDHSVMFLKYFLPGSICMAQVCPLLSSTWLLSEARNYSGIRKTHMSPKFASLRVSTFKLVSLNKSSVLPEPQFTNL